MGRYLAFAAAAEYRRKAAELRRAADRLEPDAPGKIEKLARRWEEGAVAAEMDKHTVTSVAAQDQLRH